MCVLKFLQLPSKCGNYQCNFHEQIHLLLEFQLYTYFNNDYSFEEGNFNRFI